MVDRADLDGQCINKFESERQDSIQVADGLETTGPGLCSARCRDAKEVFGCENARRYTIDRWLRFLTLEAGPASEKIEIGRLTEVSLAKELPMDGLPDGLEALRPCLLLLRFADATEIAKEVAITEADEASCETFVTCMNILRLYAQVNS
eukprot:s2125_g2.t1